MDAMRGIYKTTKAADHDTQVFWLRVKKGKQRRNCPDQVLKLLVPGKDSYRVIAGDAEMQATGFCSSTSTALNTGRSRSLECS